MVNKQSVYLKRLKELLNDKQTGLKESSNTNKTREEIIGMFEDLIDECSEAWTFVDYYQS